MSFGDGMGLFPVYVGKQIRVDKDVNAADDSIQLPPGSESDLISLDAMNAGEPRMSARPVMQGESDEDDIVVTPDAVEAAQGMVMSPSVVGVGRGRSIVKRPASPGGDLGDAVRKVLARKLRRPMFQVDAMEGEEGIELTPDALRFADEGGSDVVLSGLCGMGLGALTAAQKKAAAVKLAKAKAAAIRSKAQSAAALRMAKAQAAATKALAKQRAATLKKSSGLMVMAEAAGYPAADILTLLKAQGYKKALKTLNTLAKLKAKADVNLYRQSVDSIAAGNEMPAAAQAFDAAYPSAAYPVQPQYPDASAAPAYPQAMYEEGQVYPDSYTEDAMMDASAAAPEYDQSEVVPMSEADNAVMAEAEEPTEVPYGNAGGEDFDVDFAPGFGAVEEESAEEPRRVFPSGALRMDNLQPESAEESMITDDIEIPVGGGSADKFMDDPMRDGFMRPRVTPSRPKYDTIGDAGMPKGVTPEPEDIYEQTGAEQIDAMSRPAELSQGNFAGEPYSAGESMIPFGRSFKGKRMDILDTSVVGLSPGRMTGQRGNSPAGYDPNYLVNDEMVLLERRGEGTGEEFVSLGQLPSFGSLGMAAIENTMAMLKFRESQLMAVSPAGYEAAITPYASLRERINSDYEAMKADNTKVTTLGLAWGGSAATYKSILDRAYSAATAAKKAAAPKPKVITKEVIKRLPAAVKETVFSKYGLAIAIGGAAVIGGLLFLRSREKKG